MFLHSNHQIGQATHKEYEAKYGKTPIIRENKFAIDSSPKQIVREVRVFSGIVLALALFYMRSY